MARNPFENRRRTLVKHGQDHLAEAPGSTSKIVSMKKGTMITLTSRQQSLLAEARSLASRLTKSFEAERAWLAYPGPDRSHLNSPLCFEVVPWHRVPVREHSKEGPSFIDHAPDGRTLHQTIQICR
jgi:hypothetical protein